MFKNFSISDDHAAAQGSLHRRQDSHVDALCERFNYCITSWKRLREFPLSAERGPGGRADRLPADRGLRASHCRLGRLLVQPARQRRPGQAHPARCLPRPPPIGPTHPATYTACTLSMIVAARSTTTIPEHEPKCENKNKKCLLLIATKT